MSSNDRDDNVNPGLTSDEARLQGYDPDMDAAPDASAGQPTERRSAPQPPAGPSAGESATHPPEEGSEDSAKWQAGYSPRGTDTVGASSGPSHQPAPPRPAGTETCILIGPARSGKTVLLLALGRACYMPRKDGLEINFIPEESVSELMEHSVEIITGKKMMTSTLRSTDYSFEMHTKATLTNPWGRKRHLHNAFKMTVSDGPGGALFPDEVDSTNRGAFQDFETHLVSTASQASSIIFCVDAREPEKALLEKRLPKLISKIVQDQHYRETEPDSEGWLSRLGFRSIRQRNVSKRGFSADRFLLLLNKIDRLCAHTLGKPSEYASIIDPVEQARAILGIPLLNMIHQALKPTTDFAVGITSGLGFHPKNGRPLADKNGVVQRGPTEKPEEILDRWNPFGIRDAIFFIATGHATGSVKRIVPDDLFPNDHVRPIPVFRQPK